LKTPSVRERIINDKGMALVVRSNERTYAIPKII
jgi:hypothetical protein